MKHIIKAIAIAAMALSLSSCSFDCSKAWKEFPLNADTDFALLESQIAANPEQWKKVYDFIKDNDLASLTLGRHDIVEGGAYANVIEYDTKADCQFEAHKDYIDVQIIVDGEENMCVTALSDAVDCTMEYDKEKDVMFYSSAMNIRSYDASPAGWFIFFPSDLHRPGYIKNDTPAHVKKVVVKIPVAK